MSGSNYSKSSKKKIFLGADHNGYKLKEKIEQYLKVKGYDVKDLSGNQLDPDDDFPVHAARVANSVLSNSDSKGILICGSGQGVCMAANRFKGIRASLIWNQYEARSSRNDDDSNIMCLPAKEFDRIDNVSRLIDIWLETPFAGAQRFIRRIKEMDQL